MSDFEIVYAAKLLAFERNQARLKLRPPLPCDKGKEECISPAPPVTEKVPTTKKSTAAKVSTVTLATSTKNGPSAKTAAGQEKSRRLTATKPTKIDQHMLDWVFKVRETDPDSAKVFMELLKARYDND